MLIYTGESLPSQRHEGGGRGWIDKGADRKGKALAQVRLKTKTIIKYMELKKMNVPMDTITRDMVRLSEDTENVYETVMIIAKRANQIGQQMKQDLEKKLQDFSSSNDNLEEVFENREQIEISRYYEHLPKPGLIATAEYEQDKLYYRMPGATSTND